MKNLSFYFTVVILFFLAFTNHLQSQVGFCGMDQLMQDHFDSHPDAEAEYLQEQLELTMRARMLQGSYDNPNRGGGGGCIQPLILNENSFVIPVVFHVLYSNDGNLADEDVSYAQIQSAVNQLNQDFDCFNGYNMELRIRFELAQTPPDQGWSDPSEPGVMRLQTAASNTTIVNGDVLLNLGLPTLSDFPSSNYLNIVSSPFQMLSNGVAYTGFSPENNVFTGECKGIESFIGISGNWIGNPLDDDGSFTTVQNANFSVAGVLSHEVGHHFGLGHVGLPENPACEGNSDANCDLEGDRVCDTPPEISLNSSNQSGPFFVEGVDEGNTCNESVDYNAFYANLGVALPANRFTPFPIGSPIAGATDMYDQVENIMRSGGPSLQFFTPGQFNRMHAAILMNYPDLSSWSSLVQSGVPNTTPAVLAQIEADFDACTGITTFSCPADPGNLINANPLYAWIVNGVQVSTQNQFGITLPPGENTILLQIDNPLPCPLQFLAEDEVVLSVGNCNDNCSLVCNGGFEASNGNFTIPSVDVGLSAGVLQDNCTSGVEQLACWNSAGFAHLVQDGFPDCNYTWGSDPVGGLTPIFPNMPMPECSEFLNNEHFIRVSDVFNNEENLLGGVNTQLTAPLIAGQDYILEFDWAYRTDMAANDLLNYEIQLGFGNILCNALATGGFVDGQNDLSFIPATVVPANTWNHRVVEFTANQGDDVLYMSMIRNGAQDYFFNLSLDNVRVIPVNDNPVAIDITVTPICAGGGAVTYQVDVTATLFGPDVTFNLDLNIHENTGPNYNLLLTQNIQFNLGNFVNSQQTVGFVLPDLGVLSYLFMPEAPQGMCLVDTSPLKFEAAEGNYQVRVTHASCNGGDGEVDIDFLPNGATATLEDLGTGTLMNIPFDGLQNLQVGLYDVNITTQAGCTFTHPIEILSFANYNLNVVVDDACNNEANGSAEADPIFAGLIQTFEQTPVFGEALTTAYTWTDALLNPIGFSTPLVSGLTPGVYNMTASVGLNANLLNQLLAQNNMTNLAIPDGQGNQVVLFGIAGEVTYSVPDCIQTVPFVVGNTVNPAPTINPIAADCVNQIPGEVNITNAAGWNTFLIGDDGVLLQQAVGDINYLNLPSAVYTIIGDLNGCSFVQQVDLVDPAAVPPVIAPPVFANFCGLQALGGGEIDMTVAGNAPFDFEWIVVGGVAFAGEDLLDAAPNSTYVFSVTDACGLTTTVDVLTPNGDFALFEGSTVTNSPCGANSGQINLQLTSVFNQMANPPLFFEWTGPNGFTSNAQDIFNLAPGTYVVEVSAANSTCTFSESFEVLSDGLATAFTAQTIYNCTVTPATPNTIEVTILAPDLAPIGQWFDDQGNVLAGNVLGNVYTLPNVPEGTYTFVYQDAATCLTEDFVVPEVTLADYTLDIDINCLMNLNNPATINVEIFFGDGNGTMTWTDSDGDPVAGVQNGTVYSLVDVPTDDYTFTYVDNTSCLSHTFNTNAATFTELVDYDCDGIWGSNGEFTLIVDEPAANPFMIGGGLVFTQNGNEFFVDQLANMNQTYLYTDDDNCFISNIIVDYIPPALNSNFIAPCLGQSNGVIQLADLSANPDVISVEVCEGQFIGQNFVQSGTLVGVPSGLAGFTDYIGVDEAFDYVVKMTLQNGCVIEETFIDIVPEDGGCCFPSIAVTEGLTCGNFDFMFSCDDGNDLIWDFGDGESATGLSVNHQYCENGNFTIVVDVMNNGVVLESYSASVNVTDCDFIQVANNSAVNIGCGTECVGGYSAIVSESNNIFLDGVQIGGNGDLQSIDGLCPGEYQIDIVQLENGCTFTEQIEVEINTTNHAGYVIDEIQDLIDLSGEHFFSDDVIVSDEISLDMNGSTWYFSNGSSLIIEEASELDVQNITLTACESTWEGVNVLADAGTQTPSGSLRLIGSTIEHATTGIQSSPLNWSTNYNLTNVETWRAGDIYCLDCEFVNNLEGVVLWRSSHLNDSNVGFYFSDFTVDDDFRFVGLDEDAPLNYFRNHVRYGYVLGYDFKACTFKNEMVALSENWLERGVGIRTYNANFVLENEEILDDLDPFSIPHFEGLRYGISAAGRYKNWMGMRIYNASFDQNRVGIWTQNAYYQTIAFNHFRVGTPTIDPDINGEDDYEGIVLMGGTGFAVADNTFEGVDVLDCADCTFGVRVRDTRTSSDEIYRNTFNNLNHANLANGDNVPPSGPETGGLRYVCNTNTNNRVDFRVADFTTGLGGLEVNIATFQNATGEEPTDFESAIAAGNSFSTTVTSEGNFMNFGDLIFYYPGIPEQSPTEVSANVEVESLVDENLCDNEIFLVNDGEWNQDELYQLKTLVEETKVNYDDVRFLWLSLIDDGDTPSLQEEVDDAWPEDTWTMRDRLLSISPKVSERVLYEMLDNTLVYPHPVALEIILANPDIARDVRFMAYLETKADPMPAYMVDLIYAARDQITFRTQLEQQLSLANANYLQLASKLNRAYYHMEDSLDVAMAFQEGLNSFSLDLNESVRLVQSGENVTSVLDDLEEAYDPKFQSTDEYLQLKALLELEEILVLDGRSWDALHPNEVAELENIADNFWTFAGREAMNTLNFYYDGDYFIPPALNGSWAPRSMSTEMVFEEDEIRVFPNPADGLLNMQFNISTMNVPSNLYIYNSSGKLVHQEQLVHGQQQLAINTSTWSMGSYQWQLETAGKTYSGKFTVIH